MVRWRYCLVLAMLLLLPAKTGSKLEDDEEEDGASDVSSNRFESRLASNRYNLEISSRRGEENEEDDDDDEEEEEEEPAPVADKGERVTVVRRPPPIVQPTAKRALTVTRTIKRRPLECYVCAYKAETPLRACLDPTKYRAPTNPQVTHRHPSHYIVALQRVHTITCHSAEDKCFTSVISKGSSYEAVVRGCRSGCVGSPETTCCELNRCNNQAFAMPVIAPRSLTAVEESNKSTKPIPPTILFFVTILLVLQTVVKVAFV